MWTGGKRTDFLQHSRCEACSDVKEDKSLVILLSDNVDVRWVNSFHENNMTRLSSGFDTRGIVVKGGIFFSAVVGRIINMRLQAGCRRVYNSLEGRKTCLDFGT